jgi:hypothetical protein
MVNLKIWQWIVLGLPIAAMVGFLVAAAGSQIHQWGIDWIWAVILLVFVGWRGLLVKWLQPPTLTEVEAAIAQLEPEPEAAIKATGANLTQQAQAELQKNLQAAREDVPPWEDWLQFFRRCQTLVIAIAQIYYPQVKRPLLNIYVPQAYGLLRDTVEDVDRWMQQLSPVLGKITVGQAYEAYEVYQKLEPAARVALKIWNWAQWLLNPAVALTRTATQSHSNKVNQQLLANLGQIMREEALKALGARAIALYSGEALKDLELPTLELPTTQTQTLREILAQTESPESLKQKSVNLLLVGRTGAGKSSLINTLFVYEPATVDVLPSTDRLQDYPLQAATGEILVLWDAPGYEQVGRSDLRQQVLEQVVEADILLLVTPAMDPALQMDLNFLAEAKAQIEDLPIIAIVTQVDRLRPIRDWQPPYDWQQGKRPKEQSIRDAVQYRQEILGSYCHTVLPLVTQDLSKGREAWGATALSEALVNAIDPAKQLRLTRFLRDLETRTTAAAKIIDHYAFQMGTTQGLAALLKSPVLSFISTMITGSPALAILLTEKLPIEESPVVLGKLQMAYELFSLLVLPHSSRNFDLLELWPLLLENAKPVTHDAWALGHTLVEYWAGSLKTEQLRDRYHFYLNQSSTQTNLPKVITQTN